MAVAFGPTSCLSGFAPKNKLLHKPEAQHGFVPKLSLHSGKNLALRAKNHFLLTLTITITVFVKKGKRKI